MKIITEIHGRKLKAGDVYKFEKDNLRTIGIVSIVEGRLTFTELWKTGNTVTLTQQDLTEGTLAHFKITYLGDISEELGNLRRNLLDVH